MRNLYLLDAYRMSGPEVLEMWGWAGDNTCGAFLLPSPIDKAAIKVIASAGEGWDHVSVSRQTRCPNWPEMEYIAGLFFKDDEAAFQLHVPASDHVNNHPYCLHWWRPLGVEIPRPDALMVGIKDRGLLSPGKAMAVHREAVELGAAKLRARAP